MQKPPAFSVGVEELISDYRRSVVNCHVRHGQAKWWKGLEPTYEEIFERLLRTNKRNRDRNRAYRRECKRLQAARR